MMNNLLLYRMAVLNGLAAVAVAAAWLRGYLEIVIDSAGLFAGPIIALFALGLISAIQRGWKVSRTLNEVRNLGLRGVNGAKILEKGEHLSDVANWLVILGLLGTVTGFWIALSGVDQGSLSTASGVQRAAGQLMDGMRVALSTTLLGGFLGLWIDMNRRIIRTAAVCLAEDGR